MLSGQERCGATTTAGDKGSVEGEKRESQVKKTWGEDCKSWHPARGRDEMRSFASSLLFSDRKETNSTEAPRHLPECFAVHVFLGDSTVSERLVPHGVQRVANRLGFQFISLRVKAERGEKEKP